jgi:hypothetical protein
MSIRGLVLLIGLVAIGEGGAWAATAPLIDDPREEIFASKPKSAAADMAARANPGVSKQTADATAERVPRANPLWALPLGSFTATRERPLFSPSRRPPPPVVAAQPPAPPPPPPPKPAEPEKPQLSLVGTIVAETGEGIGLFMNNDKTAVRLKIGGDHKGWVLREVRPRQVVLEKGKQIATLEMPTHDMSKAGSAPPAMLPTAPTAPTEVPMSVLPAAPPALPDVPTAALPNTPAVPPDRSTDAVVHEAAATFSSPVDNPKAKSGFKFPPSTGSEPTAEAPTIIVQQPVVPFPEPLINPFRKAGLP